LVDITDRTVCGQLSYCRGEERRPPDTVCGTESVTKIWRTPASTSFSRASSTKRPCVDATNRSRDAPAWRRARALSAIVPPVGDHVIDDETGAILHIADHVGHRCFSPTLTAFVEHNQCSLESVRVRCCHRYPPGIRRYSAHSIRHSFPYCAAESWYRREAVYRYVKEPIQLWGVWIQRYNMANADCLQ
jgi:hypothetical protein